MFTLDVEDNQSEGGVKCAFNGNRHLHIFLRLKLLQFYSHNYNNYLPAGKKYHQKLL